MTFGDTHVVTVVLVAWGWKESSLKTWCHDQAWLLISIGPKKHGRDFVELQ